MAEQPVDPVLVDARDERPLLVEGRLPLDSAYSNAMARVYASFPGDPDVGTLYAESLMLLEPRRGTWNIANPDIQLRAVTLAWGNRLPVNRSRVLFLLVANHHAQGAVAVYNVKAFKCKFFTRRLCNKLVNGKCYHSYKQNRYAHLQNFYLFG